MNHRRLAVVVALVACVPDSSRRGPGARDQAGEAADRPPLDLSTDGVWPSPYSTDPLWQRAASGSDFDRARLARKEGASSLLAALRVGGSLGRLALGALPYAGERREVLGRLCELISGTAAPTASLLVESIYEVVANGPVSEESVDPGAEAACALQLRQLSESDRASPEDRDRAASAIARLSAR
ncbi:MAG TPA: hypothetical protein VJU61_12255 [Polyangiaceae bacterium]|nr:hypothetical protein [Polyangiaceae bacterium]